MYFSWVFLKGIFHGFFPLEVFAELLITHKMSDRRHCVPQMVLITWHLSTFFSHRTICKCIHVHFLSTVKPRGTGKGTEKTLACPPPPRTLGSCLSAGDTRMPRSGCFSYPLQCKNPARCYHDVCSSWEPHSCSFHTCTSLCPKLCFCEVRFPESASKFTHTTLRSHNQSVTTFWRLKNKQYQTNTDILHSRLTLQCRSRKRQVAEKSKESKSELHVPGETCELWGTTLPRSLLQGRTALQSFSSNLNVIDTGLVLGVPLGL